MAEEVPLKGDDSQELELGHNSKASLTIQTIGSSVKKYWFKRSNKKEETKEKKEKNGFGLSTHHKLILSVYREQLVIKIKNHINIERFLPFILIMITLFRFIYLNALLITYFRSLHTASSAACACTLVIVYFVFFLRSLIDSLDTQIIPIFTYIAVYYKLVPLRSPHVFWMQLWPLIAFILSYIVYGLLFCIFLFVIPWSLCEDDTIQSAPTIFWQWFIGWQWIPNLFNGAWNIQYLFRVQYWHSLSTVYCNYFVMSYLPYLFLIGLVFGFLLLRHIVLNIKTLFVKFLFATWSTFKAFYIILIPIILFRFIYLMCMWSVFFFSHSPTSHASIPCRIVSFTVYFVMIFHSLFDALCTPLIGIEFFMYFPCIHRRFHPLFAACFKRMCGKYIAFSKDGMDSDYGQITSDHETRVTDNRKPNAIRNTFRKLNISWNSLLKSVGRARLIVLLAVGWGVLKLILFYFVFGVIFVFISVGFLWGNCSDAQMQQTPQIIWQWFIAPTDIASLWNDEWSFRYLIQSHEWNSIQTIFINYIVISFVPYLILIGSAILIKIFTLCYRYLLILTEGFSAICGAEFTLFFVVFVFYRWLYLVFMWYQLLFHNEDREYHDTISCQITLIAVFTVIVFRSTLDSFLFIEFFLYTLDRELWPLFMVGLFWSSLKLLVSYALFAILSIFFFIGFGYMDCACSNAYVHLFWEWFVAFQYLPHLYTSFGSAWQLKYLFHRKYWTSIEILYLNYTLTAYVPLILMILALFVYYICHYKAIQHNVIFALFRKRAQLIITMLLSYSLLLSFLVYVYQMHSNFIALLALIPCAIFYKFHSYTALALSHYQSIVKYWVSKAVDWDSTWLLCASAIHSYGQRNIVWNESWNELRKNKQNKCDPNVYYYWYFRAMHTVIKVIFLFVSVVLYGLEVLFKLMALCVYVMCRWVHYMLVIGCMYFGKLGQMEWFILHYSKHCLGITPNESISDSSPANTDPNHNDSTPSQSQSNLSIRKASDIVNMHWLFNLSIFIQMVCESFGVWLMVGIDCVMHRNVAVLWNPVTLWMIIASVVVIVNALWNIVYQFKNKGNLKDTLTNHMFGADKSHSIQYGLITSDMDGACVVLGDVVQY